MPERNKKGSEVLQGLVFLPLETLRGILDVLLMSSFKEITNTHHVFDDSRNGGAWKTLKNARLLTGAGTFFFLEGFGWSFAWFGWSDSYANWTWMSCFFKTTILIQFWNVLETLDDCGMFLEQESDCEIPARVFACWHWSLKWHWTAFGILVTGRTTTIAVAHRLATCLENARKWMVAHVILQQVCGNKTREASQSWQHNTGKRWISLKSFREQHISIVYHFLVS